MTELKDAKGDAVAVRINNVDVLFGKDSERASAFELLDQGASREQILEQTGMVLGVSGASLEVPVGSISVLMGLSGSGKSSLLRCINGLNTVSRGSLLVQTNHSQNNSEHIDVASCSHKQLQNLRRHSLAMVFQQFGLLPWATVRENIGFGLSVRGESRDEIAKKVDEQLGLVGLDAWADKRIDTLSGGMQQRVGLARAFATNADILLMDEPFSALDPLIREHLQDELLLLQKKLKKTIVFVSHDLDEALKLGNRISIMDGGRIVQTGTVDDIVFNPSSDYVRRFVANINPLSVLRARHVMNGLNVEHDKQVVMGNTTISLKGLQPIACTVNAQSCELIFQSEEQSPEQLPVNTSSGVLVVHADTPLKALMSHCASTQLCTVVVNDKNELLGSIQSQDICAALGDKSQ